MGKTSDIFNPKPIKDDLFGHGSSFNNEEPPPDLDKMWKNFNKKLNRLLHLKKKGKNNVPDDDPYNTQANDSRGFRIVLLLLTLLIAVFWLAGGIYMVDEGQTAVISTFGRYTKTTSSGIHWHYPWPIQDHQFVETGRIQSVEVGYRENLSARKTNEALMMTSDQNMIEVQFTVQYRITNPTHWVFNNKEPEEVVRLCAETAFREIAVTYSFKELMDGNRDRLIELSLQRLRTMIEQYQVGIEVIGITIQDVRPPQSVQEVFADAQRAPQDVERMKNESQNYVSSIGPKANGEAEQIKIDAENYSKEIVVKAEAEVERFRRILPEYKQAPTVTKDRLYLETMEQIYANTDKVLIDSQKKPIVRLPVYNSGGYPTRAEDLKDCKDTERGSTLPGASSQSLENKRNDLTSSENAIKQRENRTDFGRNRESRARGGR